MAGNLVERRKKIEQNEQEIANSRFRTDYKSRPIGLSIFLAGILITLVFSFLSYTYLNINAKNAVPKEITPPITRSLKDKNKAAKKYVPTILKEFKIGLGSQHTTIDGIDVTVEDLTINVAGSKVRVFSIENFLTDDECDGLRRVHDKHLKDKEHPIICFDSINTLKNHLNAASSQIKASINDFTQGTTCVNESFSKSLSKLLKWSYSTSFYPGESRFSTIFEKRVQQFTGLISNNGGKYQLTSYPVGVGYKTHTDCMLNSPEKRDRVATILVYLQGVEDGGETSFSELGISVRPKKGRAIVWNSMDSDGLCLSQSIHQASPVKRGHKYILQRWYYYQSFPSLGKRTPEPVQPIRAWQQPRVSCDEYEHGSCRWYDEWNYEHIHEYQNIKRFLS